MMKVYYDDEVDALYLKLGDESPEGVIELSEGVNLDTTSEDKIVDIEILNAPKKIDLLQRNFHFMYAAFRVARTNGVCPCCLCNLMFRNFNV